jgi:hypothetical protein
VRRKPRRDDRVPRHEPEGRSAVPHSVVTAGLVVASYSGPRRDGREQRKSRRCRHLDRFRHISRAERPDERMRRWIACRLHGRVDRMFLLVLHVFDACLNDDGVDSSRERGGKDRVNLHRVED